MNTHNIPEPIHDFIDQVRTILSNYGLSVLSNRLDDREFVTSVILNKFKEMERNNIPIPQDLDWIYSCY